MAVEQIVYTAVVAILFCDVSYVSNESLFCLLHLTDFKQDQEEVMQTTHTSI